MSIAQLIFFNVNELSKPIEIQLVIHTLCVVLEKNYSFNTETATVNKTAHNTSLYKHVNNKILIEKNDSSGRNILKILQLYTGAVLQ